MSHRAGRLCCGQLQRVGGDVPPSSVNVMLMYLTVNVMAVNVMYLTVNVVDW